ncbi:MAG TPA: dephospho-CoA kinase [Chthoniobacterales bacterium]|nr:dephospho-CoA kinase [Chthoniobacterales bacterium]
MPAIGITGGVSTGKSTFCECLKEILPAAKFFDADDVARQLVDLEEVKQELLAQFGFGIFLRNGDLNREAVRTIIFQDAAKKSALEQILHPRIRRQWSVEADKHRTSPEFFFADIPLLYETGGETLCDRVVVVACSPEIQLANLMRRMEIARAAAEAMIKSQMPLEEKIKRADHVTWNNGDRTVLAAQAASLVDLWRQEKWTKS